MQMNLGKEQNLTFMPVSSSSGFLIAFRKAIVTQILIKTRLVNINTGPKK